MTGALAFNGVDGATGRLLQPEMSIDAMVALIRGDGAPEPQQGELRQRALTAEPTLGLMHGHDPEDLAEAGWGLVVAHDAPAEVLDALAPLLELRRGQAGPRFRVFAGDDGLRPDQDKSDFLARFGAGPGPVDPHVMPYYLLLAGGPDAIPFRFQYQLDVQHAVGRLDFDSPEEHARYAAAVVAAEAPVGPRRSAGLFAPCNDGDAATAQSAGELVAPLAGELAAAMPGWDVAADVGLAADKARLGELLWGEEAPALVMTASHGLAFPAGHPLQREAQGALVCQDWPGPADADAPVSPGAYMAGGDVPAARAVGASVVVSFACFGAGTPALDDFAHLGAAPAAAAIAPGAFVARLPQALLAHEPGGALAFVGHVERAWGYSFSWPGAGAQRAVFASMLGALMDGWRVGHAMEYFNQRYAEISSDLSEYLERIRNYAQRPDPSRLVGTWTANNDARSYTVLGDPAVRIPGAAS